MCVFFMSNGQSPMDFMMILVFVSFQEIWNSPYSNDSFPVYAEDIDAGGDASPSTAMLSEVSRALKITIVGGSIPERCGDRLHNTCCVFDTDGKLIAKHRKVTLNILALDVCLSYAIFPPLSFGCLNVVHF